VVIPGSAGRGAGVRPEGADVLISNLSAIWTPLTPATMPAELARVHVSPAYQESSYITGERVGVTGGMPMP
jgi:hypothetical protein